MSYGYYFWPCHDSGCKKEVAVDDINKELILCYSCAEDFKRELKNGFPGGYDEETHDMYMEKFGNKKERASRILDELLKENDDDTDDEE